MHTLVGESGCSPCGRLQLSCCGHSRIIWLRTVTMYPSQSVNAGAKGLDIYKLFSRLTASAGRECVIRSRGLGQALQRPTARTRPG